MCKFQWAEEANASKIANECKNTSLYHIYFHVVYAIIPFWCRCHVRCEIIAWQMIRKNPQIKINLLSLRSASHRCIPNMQWLALVNRHICHQYIDAKKVYKIFWQIDTNLLWISPSFFYVRFFYIQFFFILVLLIKLTTKD